MVETRRRREWPSELFREYRQIEAKSKQFLELFSRIYEAGVARKNPYIIRDYLPLLNGYLMEIAVQVEICQTANTEGRTPNWVIAALASIDRKTVELTGRLERMERNWNGGADILRPISVAIINDITALRSELAQGPKPSTSSILEFKRKASGE